MVGRELQEIGPARFWPKHAKVVFSVDKASCERMVLKLATVGERSRISGVQQVGCVMGISLELRSDAVECLRLASQVKARRHKALLMDLARAWICVAEHMEQMRASHNQRRSQTRKLYQ